jgi:uncharacterized protein (TIGR02246 family)
MTHLDPADVLEILQLVARADGCASARDAEGYAALFTEDAVMDGDMGRAEGRAQLAETVARVWAREPAGTLHLTLNAVVDETSPDITVRSTMLMVASGSPGGVIGSAQVAQTVRRTGQGWRVVARTIAAP